MNITHLNNPLIRELIADPARFQERGRAYQLLEEYFAGLSVETLRTLLRHDDMQVRQAALWVASELGEQASVLLDDVLPLMNLDDRFLAYHALEVAIVCAIGNRVHQFIAVPRALESEDDVIRVLAMRLLTRADPTQLQAAAECSDKISANEDSHRRGLLLLAVCESADPEEVRRMMRDDNPVAAVYGAIAAKRLRDKHPGLLQVAMEIPDASVRRFAKE